jgi:hypothetical protein
MVWGKTGNKLVDTLEEAIARVHRIASMNCKRNGHQTPCAESGMCTGCYRRYAVISNGFRGAKGYPAPLYPIGYTHNHISIKITGDSGHHITNKPRFAAAKVQGNGIGLVTQD